MNQTSIITVIGSFAISAILGPILIPLLRRIKARQTVRGEGPKSHLKKTGTPTMGGIMILASVLIICLIYLKNYPKILPILFLTVGFGLVGFLDDYLKVVLRRSTGLYAWQKLLGQIFIISIFTYYLLHYTNQSLAMKVPFVKGMFFDPGIWSIPILFFIVLGTVNGVNLTDGLDGLAGSVTMIIAMFFSVMAVGLRSGLEPITCAVVGALMGFLLFNVFPASVFMGDTGSLALGGFVAGTAIMLQMQLFIPIVGLIYVVEAASVILQVGYYKLSGGKRIFKMAPLHHHFELSGFEETRIVAACCIITAIMALVALFIQ
ncbi:MAG: phospho-N-acetylmuramoyl-pentapeptide-transferase [Clostridium sp.]|jgi:phospho-N-acetylmuramoyl-pentapeptide-transferase|nr:phospho-N-acetylmuramoyl-pentapeptide-transferase [Clostridium sp.]